MTNESSIKRPRVRWPLEVPQYTPTYVEWVDSVRHSDGKSLKKSYNENVTWDSVSELGEEHVSDTRVWQSGLLFKITDQYISLVFATDKEDQVCGKFIIPRPAVVRLRFFKV